jgi:hypothetical protein
LNKGDEKEAVRKLSDALAVKNAHLRTDLKDLFDNARAHEDNYAQRKIRAEVKAAWKRGDFDALDRIAQKLRDSQAAYPDGRWQLDTFYDVLSLDAGQPEKVWQKHLAAMREWTKHSPDSPTPLVAWGDNLVDYAWRARGSGYADTVSKDGWDKMGKRLGLAGGVAKAAEALSTKCPHTASVKQSIALGASMPRETYDALVGSMLNLFPTYSPIYLSQAWYLQPRWNGEEGEWNKVAEAQCDKVGGTAGDALYAQIAWSLVTYYDNVIDDAGVNYERAKRGFAALRKQYPKSKMVPLMQARFATLANDKATVAMLTK